MRFIIVCLSSGSSLIQTMRNSRSGKTLLNLHSCGCWGSEKSIQCYMMQRDTQYNVIASTAMTSSHMLHCNIIWLAIMSFGAVWCSTTWHDAIWTQCAMIRNIVVVSTPNLSWTPSAPYISCFHITNKRDDTNAVLLENLSEHRAGKSEEKKNIIIFFPP